MFKGLSPRVRGNRLGWNCHAQQRRTIPACAGEPHKDNVKAVLLRDYPRVCGGTAYRVSLPSAHPGLSPRVRGNPQDRAHDTAHHGTIPACAGEPNTAPPFPCRILDYPRVCGGTFRNKPFAGDAGGLSPRVRGNHMMNALSVKRSRTIPACAGEPLPIHKPAPHD